MHLGQRDGERESGAEHRVCEPVRRHVGGGPERHAIGVQDASFGHHLNLFLEFAASRRAVDAAAAGENRRPSAAASCAPKSDEPRMYSGTCRPSPG